MQRNGEGLVRAVLTQRIFAVFLVVLASSYAWTGTAEAKTHCRHPVGVIAFSSNMTNGRGVHNPEGDYEIFTVNPHGGGLKQLTYNSTDDFGPDYSADGGWITFSRVHNGNEEIYKMKADGSHQRELTNTPGANNSFPTWSPNSKYIVFTSNRDGNFEVYTMKADGSDPDNISNTPYDDSVPDWAPDGGKIAFNTNRDGNYEIYTMKSDGSHPEDLTNTPNANELIPRWSPDGKRLSFSSDRDGSTPNSFIGDIFKMKANGKDQDNLTHTPSASELFSSWSPDGKQISFDSNRNDPTSTQADIYKVKTNGKHQRRVYGVAGADDYDPAWSPGSAETSNSR